jgi:catechol 2,3-dioxygenase-like lactoylglutathione lyase family enzyme
MPKVTGLGHFGVYVEDMPRMLDFYTNVLGMTITDRSPDDRAVFLSARPAEQHHELTLVHSPDQRTDAGQISFHVDTLQDLKALHGRVTAAADPQAERAPERPLPVLPRPSGWPAALDLHRQSPGRKRAVAGPFAAPVSCSGRALATEDEGLGTTSPSAGKNWPLTFRTATAACTCWSAPTASSRGASWSGSMAHMPARLKTGPTPT